MMVVMQNLILKKFLLTTFYVSTSCFSFIRFIIIRSTPNLVNCFTSVFFTTCFATQQVDKTFAIAVKIIIVFVRNLVRKLERIKYLYTCTYLTTHLTSHSPFYEV